MNREELMDHHRDITEIARELMERKNEDYAGQGGSEPFANFTRCEVLGICSTEKGFLVRMTDKMSRLSSFFESGRFSVKDENLEDTCIDIINYAILLMAYRRDKNDISQG